MTICYFAFAKYLKIVTAAAISTLVFHLSYTDNISLFNVDFRDPKLKWKL